MWVAAPSAAALLADWGADVIKVEAPDRRSDAQRLRVARHRQRPAQPGLRPRQPGQAQRRARPARRRRTGSSLEELLATADVFITNLRPDALDGLDLEPDATVARHPRLVYCSISGYGLRGEDRNRPTYDIGAFWARSGLSMQMADGDGSPSTPAAASATTSPGWPRWPACWPRCSSSGQTGLRAGGRGLAAPDRAPTCSDGTWACR